jgi:hypothetical protein
MPSKITLLLIALLYSFIFKSVSAQTIIWGGPGDPNSEFAGGPNAWTVNGIFCGQGVNGVNARWTHSTTGVSRGGFASSDRRIQSPSFNNGVMIFDSDFLDNSGNQNNTNGGACPYLHRGELISPIIDMSNHSQVVLRFNQYFRWYLGPGGDEDVPPSFVEVSGDGGVNWTVFSINADLPFDTYTDPDDVILLNISSVAANRSNVRIKFVFDGDAYFWMIDDVWLLGELPPNDLSMSIASSPLTALYIPQAYQGAEEWPFSASVSNKGTVAINDAFLKVSILNATGQVQWSDSMALSLMNVGVEDRVEITDFSYRPQGLRPGRHTIEYLVYQPGIADATPNNNKQLIDFFITDNTFWQSADLITFSRPNFDGPLRPWGWGSYFITDPMTQERFILRSVEGGVAGEASEADLVGKKAEVFVSEILSFEIGNPGTSIGDGVTNVVLAVGTKNLTVADDLQRVTFELEDLNGSTDPFLIENGVAYKVLLLVDQGVLIGFDDDFLNIPLDLSDSENGTANLYWDDEFIGANFLDAMPFLKLNLELVTSVDHRPLPDVTVSIYPNPASHVAEIRLSMEESSPITITVAHLNGSVLDFVTLPPSIEHHHILDTSRLPSGVYLVRIATNQGTKTKQLVITK